MTSDEDLPLDDLPPAPLPAELPPHDTRPVSASGDHPSKNGRAASRFRIADRRRQVAALVLARVQEAEIAKHLRVSRGTVKKDKTVILDRWREAAQRDILEARGHAAAALDADEVRLRALYDRLEQRGEDEAAIEVYDRILKIQERRSKLLGLDAPEQKEIRFPLAWRGATVVRDEPRPLDSARETLAILLECGAIAPPVGEPPPEPELPALEAQPGSALPTRGVDEAEADEVRPDDADGQTGRVPLPPLS